MSEIFVSYAREDLPFVERLRRILEGEGLDLWVDVEGLYAGEEFWPEVAKAIDRAVVFLFVMTPESVASRYCGQEVERAVASRKRIVPVCRRAVDEERLHPELGARQWVFFREGDDEAAAREALLSALRADWVRLRHGARLLDRAREWEAKERDGSLLLRGRELREAEAWLAEAPDDATPLHAELIRASRRATRRFRLRLAGAATAALVAIALITGFGLSQRVASLNNLSLDDLNRGAAEAAIEKLERADALCRRFSSLFSGCRDAAFNLGRAYLDAGRFPEAREQLTRVADATEDAPADDPVAQDFRATVHQTRAYTRILLAETALDGPERLAEYDRAERDLVTATAAYDRTPGGAASRPTALTRARILIGRGDLRGAEEELERAGRVSDAADIDLLLSVVHHCRPDRSLADQMQSVEHLRRYLDKLPGRLQDPRWLLARDYYRRILERCDDARS
jgi:tetratricopeptide (TPR) repeat protein